MIQLRTMLAHRGYHRVQHVEKHGLANATIVHGMNADQSSIVVVMWRRGNEPLGKQVVNQIVGRFSHIVDRIIVFSDRITHTALNILHANPAYELLTSADIVIEKPAHFLVPKYRVLDTVAAALVEAKYGPRHLFGKILYRQDAIARYLGMQPNQVVEITNSSTNGGIAVLYRTVTVSQNM